MRYTFLLAVLLVLGLSACSDSVISNEYGESATESSQLQDVPAAPTAAENGKLRFPHLMDRARSSSIAGKDGSTVHLFLALNEYEADGVTRRVMDSYGITRRIMQEYGVTRRVLESYGITRRVLEQYGVTRRIMEEYGVTRRVLESYGITRRVLEQYATVTDELLAEYGVTLEMLEAQGVTRRVMDSYGVTRRVLNEYGATISDYETAVESFDSVIRLRLRVSKTRPGISISFGDAYLDSILEELYFDPDVDIIDPDYEMEDGMYDVRRGMRESQEMIPWSLQRIGGIFTVIPDQDVHVYVLDSGVHDFDLDVAEKKDFTMLFQNRDQEMMDEEAIINMGVYDPGDAGNWRDQSGHGSHVAGTIGAEKNDKGVRGVARGVKLHSLKVLTNEGRTDLTTVMAAVDYVTDQKQQNPLRPTVMNLSLGMDLGSGAYNSLDESIKRATEFGVVVVVSAGNDGQDAATYSPAHVREAITVGAYGQDDRFALYSNYGSVVDILAPGTDIVSLTHLPEEAAAHDNVLMTGTSHAAPHVAGAAALYLALNPTASPAEVKQALINHGRTGIEAVPMGTTDRTVYVGEFAGDGLTMDFAVLKAEWKDGSRIELDGEGDRLGSVKIFGEVDGALLGEFAIDESGAWSGSVTPEGDIPCKIVARSGSSSVTVSVVNAPLTCLKSFLIDQATWHKKSGLTVKGDGRAGATVTLIDDATGLELGQQTIDGNGGWKFEKLSSEICTARATDGESVKTLAVEGVRNCATTGGGETTSSLVIDKVSYGFSESGTPGFKIKGSTAPFERLAAFNGISGAPLGEFDADDKGSFEAEWRAPASVPCEIRTVVLSTGAESIDTVENAPEDCVGGSRLVSASWNADMQWLQVKAAGAPFQSLTLMNGRNDAPFHHGELDATGYFDKEFRNQEFVPCSVSATIDGAAFSLPVAGAPADCDVALVLNTNQWSDAQWFLSLGGTGTPGMPVSLHNADTASEFAETQVDGNGNWRLDLDLSETPVPPCSVSAYGANGDIVTVGIAASMCNPNFVYRAPGEEWEQNPYSFVEISKAEYNNGNLILEGDGYVFMKAMLFSDGTDDFYGVDVVDTNEEWSVTVSNPAVVPCVIRAELDGRMVTREVSNAPLNCDGKDFIEVTKAEYDSGKRRLTLQGTALAAAGVAPVEFRLPVSGDLVATIGPDDGGDFSETLSKLAPADSPCALTATVGGTTIDVTMGKVSGECRW